MKPLILTPGFGDNAPTATLYYGQDVRKSLRLLPDASVNTVCTSPPYFGLRDYGTGDQQIGQEPTPDEFVESLVEVFHEVKRVLRPDGTLWVNLGDSYAGSGGYSPDAPSNKNRKSSETFHGGSAAGSAARIKKNAGHVPTGLKAKDLIGIPWRVALALQADGWYLRSDVIWAKGNPMPESVRDRPTKAHEYVFLFAHPESGGKYYYDQDAIREPLKAASRDRNKYGWKSKQRTHDPREQRDGPDRTHVFDESVGSNKRTVWNVNPKSYRGAHFATWPPALVEPMILAGCPAGGTVLDPFSGSATTGMVATQRGRNYVGIDLNTDYLDLAKARVEGRRAPKTPEPSTDPNIFDLFGGGV